MADLIRFLYASDIQLGRPLRGVAAWPEDCLDDIVDAPYQTMDNIVDAAIDKSVSFILLAGNILDPLKSSPRTIQRFLECCRRLGEKKIDVIWVEGENDHFRDWPNGISMPSNLRQLTHWSSEPYLLEYRNRPSVLLVDLNDPEATHSAYFNDEPGFVVGVNTQGKPPENTGQFNTDFVVLGGRSSFRETSISGTPGVYSGNPQPRSPGVSQEGCVIEVQLRPDQIHWSKLPVAAVRFFDEQIDLEAAPKLESLKEKLGDASLELGSNMAGFSAGDVHCIVRWTINVPIADYAEFEAAEFETALESWLRNEFANGSTKIWTYRVEIHASGKTPSSWCEEDTILGDFLRALGEFERDESKALDFAKQIRGDHPAFRELLGDENSADERERVLQRVRELGVALLRG